MSKKIALFAAASLLAAPAALAQDASSGGVLIGVGYDGPNEDNPETLRASLRGTVPVISGPGAGVAVVVPLSIASSSDTGFGWQTQNTALELVPSARAVIGSGQKVRVYGDMGMGFVWRFSETETWFGDASEQRTAAMTRTAVGVELGGVEPGSVALVVEPVSFQRYGFDEDGTNRFSVMAGISSRW